MTLPEDEILAARILVVDDQAVNVRLLERVLADAGYKSVTSTLEGQQVSALHRSHDYDLILLDLQMPVMDGFEVMAALQDAGRDGYLPVIVLTAQPSHKLRALQAGAKDFISKPFDLLEARTRIHNMLEVRLLYRRLEQHNQVLEETVQMRTAELRESEARYRHLTELAADWHWEQDEHGNFTKIHGPVLQMLGVPDGTEPPEAGWDEPDRVALRAAIAARRPFLDFPFGRVNAQGFRQRYRVSGEPMFSPTCRYIGYRGIGVEVGPREPSDG
jgi:CheY-like chemotaxis protein